MALKPIDTFSLDKHYLIKDRWEVISKIGQGAFGQTYIAFDRFSKEQVAIKVEPLANKKQVLKVEVTLLRRLQDSPFAAKYVGCGRQDDFNFLAMELLGKNVSELRRKRHDHTFSIATTALLSKQMLYAIQAIHDHGYLHRDIKPSNFVMGLRRSADPAMFGRSRCFIIDFGLSRRHLGRNGEVRESRDVAGFRGTARYAAIAAHRNQELGRKDDLWSLFYIMIEFITGGLPWRKEKEKEKIGEMKIRLHGTQLVDKLPPPLKEWMVYLDSLKYEDRPNYGYLSKLLDILFEYSGEPSDVPYDWERPSPMVSMGSWVSTPAPTSSQFGRKQGNTSGNLQQVVSNTTPMKGSVNTGPEVDSSSPELSEKNRDDQISRKNTNRSIKSTGQTTNHPPTFFQRVAEKLHMKSNKKDSLSLNALPPPIPEKKRSPGRFFGIFSPKTPEDSPPKKGMFSRRFGFGKQNA